MSSEVCRLLAQVTTISFTTSTAIAILNDVARSLSTQGIDRLIILNTHGGNEFKPSVRDASAAFDMMIVVANFFQMAPDVHAATFEEPGSHADEMETSLMLHMRPDLVAMEHAGTVEKRPFALTALQNMACGHHDLGQKFIQTQAMAILQRVLPKRASDILMRSPKR